MVFIYQRQRAIHGNSVLDIDSILMTLGDRILEQRTIVVQKFYSNIVDLHFIQSNEGVNITVDNDTRRLVYHEDVVKNDWVRVYSLNVETNERARDESVVTEDEDCIVF
mgnify:CR=1 FL=1